MIRDTLDEAVVAMLAAATGKEVGLSKLPPLTNPGDLHPPLPYAVLYALHSPIGSGGFEDPEEDRDYIYQLTCIGETHKQCAWMSAKILEAFTDRAANGDYTNPITGSGWYVQWRRSDGLGAILPSGEDLYQSQDTYRIRTGRA